MNWVRTGPDGVRLSLRIIPRADRNAVQGIQGDALKIRLQAPPVDNKANEALVRFLAERLDLPNARIRLLGGATGRNYSTWPVGCRNCWPNRPARSTAQTRRQPPIRWPDYAGPSSAAPAFLAGC